jgi:hypothetical protein
MMLFILATIALVLPNEYFEVNLFNADTEEIDINASQLTVNTTDDLRVAKDRLSVFKYSQRDVNQNHCQDFWNNIKKLFRYKVYIVSTAAVIVLLYIVTAVQYWVSDYLFAVLNVKPELVTAIFVTTCVTAPTMGIIIGGLVVHKYGGYESNAASVWCVIFGFICCICSLVIPMINNVCVFAVLLWLFFFFGGAIVPNINGILISSLPVELKGAGNSLTTTLVNAFGLLPAPYVYSVIYDATSRTNAKIALALTVNFAWVALIFLGFSLLFRNRQQEKELNTTKHEIRENVIIC